MDYEKKYNEALNDMRAIYPNLKGDAKLAVEHAFPELRESEDERTRKWILEYLYDGLRKADEQFKDHFKSAIDWLEKQKEQKPTSFNEPYNPDEYEVVMEGNATNLKRKEQNPTWSEEDETTIQSVIELLKTYFKEDDLIGLSNLKTAISPNDLIERLKSLRPQPKQEWSKEDKEKLYQVIETLLADKEVAIREYPLCKPLHEAYDDMIAFLKSLRPQPKQELQIKEGDKVTIHCRKNRKEDIITIYDGKVGEVIHVWDAKRNPWGHIGVRLDNGCNNGFYEDELEVLDEPQWKPSEEQMRGLKYFLDYHRPQRNAGTTAWKEFDSVDSLYEQLKKL